MNPVEVQKATEDLITERDRLNAQAPASQGQNAGQAAAAGQVAATGTTGAKKPTKTAVTAKAKNRAAKSAPQQAVAVPPATTASAQGAGMQTAGSDAKP